MLWRQHEQELKQVIKLSPKSISSDLTGNFFYSKGVSPHLNNHRKVPERFSWQWTPDHVYLTVTEQDQYEPNWDQTLWTQLSF